MLHAIVVHIFLGCPAVLAFHKKIHWGEGRREKRLLVVIFRITNWSALEAVALSTYVLTKNVVMSVV